MIKLVRDGGFTGLSRVKFPLAVPDEKVKRFFLGLVKVDAEFMREAGAVLNRQDIGYDSYYIFESDDYEEVP